MAFGLGTGAEKGRIVGYTREGEPVYEGDMRVGGTKDPEQLNSLEPVAKAIREGDAERYGAPVGRNSLSEALPPMPTRGMGAQKANGGRYSDALPPMPEPLGGPRQTPAPSYPSADVAGYGRAGADMSDIAPMGADGSGPVGATGVAPMGKTPDPLGSIDDDEGSNAGLYVAGAGATGLANLLAQRRNKLPPAPELFAGTSGYGGGMSPSGAGSSAGSGAKPGVASKGKFGGLGAGSGTSGYGGGGGGVSPSGAGSRAGSGTSGYGGGGGGVSPSGAGSSAGRGAKPGVAYEEKFSGIGRGAKPGVASEEKFSQLGEGQRVLPGGKNLPGSPKSRVSSEGKPLKLGEGQKVLPGSASKKALPGGKTPLQLTDPNAPIDLSFLGGDSNAGYLPHKLTQPEDTIRFDPYSGPIENDAGAVFDAAVKGEKKKAKLAFPKGFPEGSSQSGSVSDTMDDGKRFEFPNSGRPGVKSESTGKKAKLAFPDGLPKSGATSKSALGASIGAEGEYLNSARNALQSLGKTAKASQVAEALAPHVIPVLKAHYKTSNVTADGRVQNPDAALRDVQSELRNIYGKGKPQAEIDAVAAKLAKLLMGRK